MKEYLQKEQHTRQRVVNTEETELTQDEAPKQSRCSFIAVSALERSHILNMKSSASHMQVFIVSLYFRALQWPEKLVTKKR